MVHGDGMDAGPTLAGRALAADAGREQSVRLRRFAFGRCGMHIGGLILCGFGSVHDGRKEHACVAPQR